MLLRKDERYVNGISAGFCNTLGNSVIPNYAIAQMRDTPVHALWIAQCKSTSYGGGYLKNYQRGAAMLHHTNRHTLPSTLLLCASSLSFEAHAWISFNHLPNRNPGLWEMTTLTDTHPNQTIIDRLCVDENTDRLMKGMGYEANKLDPDHKEDVGPPACKVKIRKEGAALVTYEYCREKADVFMLFTKTEGDFTKDFTTLIEHKELRLGKKPYYGKASIRYKLLGPCANGQKPGDVINPDGSTLTNVQPREIVKDGPSSTVTNFEPVRNK